MKGSHGNKEHLRFNLVHVSTVQVCSDYVRYASHMQRGAGKLPARDMTPSAFRSLRRYSQSFCLLVVPGHTRLKAGCDPQRPSPFPRRAADASSS